MEGDFGSLLRKTRSDAGKTMGELARELEVSVTYVSDVERAKRPPLSSDRILKASAFLGCDPTELLKSAAAFRGSVELSLAGASARAQAVGAALMRGWPELRDDELDEIERIVKRRS